MARLIAFLGLWLAVFAMQGAARAAPALLLAPGSGTVRALVVGIDGYRHVNPLRGAVADARDIETTLRTMGAGDVTSLIDDAATRASLLQALQGLVERSKTGDLVIVTLAGHGSKEDERVKGSSQDGSDEVFLLSGFDPKTPSGGAEKLLNHEFKHYIKAIEAQGAQVIFVADTCYGGGLAREIAVGAPEVTYRQVRYRLAEDDLKPVSTPAEAFLTEFDFNQTTFLAAVDSETKAPEVIINGAYRGALSYAVARALEGAADEKHDGRITMRELFNYARKVVYQLSDERQNIVAMQSPTRDLDRDIVLQLGTRSPTAASSGAASAPAAAPLKAADQPKRAVRLASMTSRAGVFAKLRPLLTPFEVVDIDAAPDVVWDPVAHEAYGGNDKVALDVALEDLPGVIDRTAAIRDLKDLVVKAPQDIRLLPDASLHREGSQVQVEVTNAAGANLILVDITGGGKVQVLYPIGRKQPPLTSAGFHVPFVVRDPFGADEVLAITSKGDMQRLVDAIGELDNRRSAGRLFDVITKFGPPDQKLGMVGLFTVP